MGKLQAVAGGLAGLAGLLKAGGNVEAANASFQAEREAQAKARAERDKARKERQKRANRASKRRYQCPICGETANPVSAASVLYKLVNGNVLTVAGWVCEGHGEGDTVRGGVGEVTNIARNVTLTVEPQGRFYTATPIPEANEPMAEQYTYTTHTYAKVHGISVSTAGKALLKLYRLGGATRERKGNGYTYTING